MTYRALAADYDGTIAQHGVAEDRTVEALQSARDAGFAIVLVTGRKLCSLLNTFAHPEVFDVVVAENGAVLLTPAQQTVVALSEPPPPALVETLRRNNVPISVGQTIIATVVPHEPALRTAIQTLGLDWHVVRNKGAVMALPRMVTKATGLTVALRQLRIAPGETVGIGDAENDQDFLGMCGLSVAVANALPSVKSCVDRVTVGARGAGVEELLRDLVTRHDF